MELKLAYGVTLLVIQFLVPTSIMAYCYWKILQKVGIQIIFQNLAHYFFEFTQKIGFLGRSDLKFRSDRKADRLHKKSYSFCLPLHILINFNDGKVLLQFK